jgi:ketosteroid isomerase-like protein
MRVRPSNLLFAALVAAALFPPLYAWLLRLMLRHNVERLREGDIGPFLGVYADDARLVFPGRNSWGREYSGKAEIEQFLRRFLGAGLKAETHEVLVHGPPWNTTISVRLTDEARAPDGTVVYENRAIVFAKVAWGKIVFEEVYEDTQKVAKFDEYLATVGEPVPV